MVMTLSGKDSRPFPHLFVKAPDEARWLRLNRVALFLSVSDRICKLNTPCLYMLAGLLSTLVEHS